MTYIWIATSATYYTFVYSIKSLPGDIFVLNTSSSLSEMASVLFSFYFYKRLGLKKALFISFMLVCFGALSVMVV